MRTLRLMAVLTLAMSFAPEVGRAAADRIIQPVEDSRRVVVKNNLHPLLLAQYDRGPVEPSMEIKEITMLLKPAAGIEEFLAGLQTRSSPNYRRWLTPEQFADRFGVSEGDIAKLTAWLESQGLRVERVARGRNWIMFGGPAESVGRAFRTEIHRYRVNGEQHFGNITAPSVPAAFEGVAGGFTGLHDVRPKPAYVKARVQPASNPAFESGSNHYLAPDDFAAIYDVVPLYAAGFDGTGQSLVVVGQTGVDLADIRAFRQRFNLPASDPQLVLTGADPGTTADLMEADLDLEWAGAVARGANIIYVYSGNVNTSAQYAIDQNLAPVITMSYGGCETENTPALRVVAQQANAQGITWLAASGDQGAATCDSSAPTPQAAKGATVSFPASVPEVTAVGGTTLNEGAGAYWSAGNSANGGSALSYIPEVVWNDSATRNALTAGGGGASVLFSKPVWQVGPGVPNDSARDVPDMALAASADHDGYLIDTAGSLAVVGGTSASTPAMAGIAALLNHYLTANGTLAQPGLGNINPMLYRLAQASTNVFHDVTAGDNKVPCEQDSPNCYNGMVGFAAAPGYDLATGLGSVDAYQLATQWNTATSTTTTLTASPSSGVSLTDTVLLTATVAASAGSAGTVPTGAVVFLTADNPLGTVTLSASGSAAFTVSAAMIAAGNGTVLALYSGDSVYSPSSGSAPVTLAYPAGKSVVVPSCSPSPVTQGTGGLWPFTLKLTEKAGVASTLTGFTFDGAASKLSYWSGTAIPASGSITASLAASGIAIPSNHVFQFSGKGADGQAWTQQTTVRFVGPAGPVLTPVASLTATPAVLVEQNPQSDPSCQWTQQLTLEEQSGFAARVGLFQAGSTLYSIAQIQELFGTTRLAPWGTLQGTMCWSAIPSPPVLSYQLMLFPEAGSPVIISSSAAFGPARQNAAAWSVAPMAITVSLADSSGSAFPTVTLSASGGAPQWQTSVLPVTGRTNWLGASIAIGSDGSTGQVNLQVNPSGLSNGAYQAILVIEADNAVPQVIEVPVTLIVGASSTTTISGAVNAASQQAAFAPGMQMVVSGSQLAPGAGQADPNMSSLPLSMQGVSATVNGITAPLYSISPSQVTIQIPYETTLGTAVLAVNNNGQVAVYPLPITVAAPGIFADSNGALLPNATARQGQNIAASITGDGDLSPTLATGANPSPATRVSSLPAPRLPITVTVGGAAAKVTFAGVTPGQTGVTQINFTLPPDAPLGVQPVVVTVGGVASPPANLTVTQSLNQ